MAESRPYRRQTMPLRIHRVRSPRSYRWLQPAPGAMCNSLRRRTRCLTPTASERVAPVATAATSASPWARCMHSTRFSLELALLVMATATAAGQGTATAPPPGYAGSEACGTCHEDIANAFGRNPHHAVEADARRGWQGRSGESCHGPGQKHTESTSAEDIRNPGKVAAAAAGKLCLTC